VLVYAGPDLERLLAGYLTHLACRAAEAGIAVSSQSPLLVNLDQPPLLAPLRDGTVRDMTKSLHRKGIGPHGWTPHWFRHAHAISPVFRAGVEGPPSRSMAPFNDRVTFLGDAMSAVVLGVSEVRTLIGRPPVIVAQMSAPSPWNPQPSCCPRRTGW
jgi:hypothetical protein